MSLNDREIRTALVDMLLNQSNKPQKIIHELSINNGNAIADVVTIHKETHCYEIKGDGDKIERLKTQGAFYNLSFRKITLVTTLKHEKKALSTIPSFWGLIIVSESDDKITLKYKRKALQNSFFNKKIAIQTLWKDEMLNILAEYNIKIKNKDKNRNTLEDLLSNQMTKKELNEKISSLLIDRKNSFIKHVS